MGLQGDTNLEHGPASGTGGVVRQAHLPLDEDSQRTLIPIEVSWASALLSLCTLQQELPRNVTGGCGERLE